jgi:formate/nitrite transporter FocA (FNT family)
MATVVAGLPKTIGTISKFVGGALFPVGLILVILGGADLFTGNWLGAMFIAYIAIASGLLSVQPWLTRLF